MSMITDGVAEGINQAGSWKGWAELENDPVRPAMPCSLSARLNSFQVIFTTLLREWGVPNVQVHEIVPLDAVFDHPPESVYGLIFLSRWAPAETENNCTEAPQGVWFANQVSPLTTFPQYQLIMADICFLMCNRCPYEHCQ